MLDKLFIAVLNMSLIGSYVIVFVLLARLLLKKAPKIFSYALWGIVLLRLLCPFSFESVLSLVPMAKSPIPQDIIYNQAPQINTVIAAFDSVINTILPMPSNIGESINPIQIWLFIGAVIWAIGIATMVIYSIIAFIKLERSLIGAAPLKANIYLADHISSPFVMGLFKPKIYLPSSLSDSEKDFIIAHEACHIRRFDYVTRILWFVALTIHWFNPLVWIAFIVSGKDMEMSCDEAVMKKMDTDIRAEYSQSLLRFGTTKRMIHATPLAFGEGDTRKRVKNVLSYKKPALWVLVVSVIAVVSVGIGLGANPHSDRVSMQWAKGLRVEDIASVELVTTYGDENQRYQLCEPEQFPDIVKLVNGSRGKYIPQPETIAGGGRTLYINTLDGTRHRLSNNGNVYLVIDGDSFEMSRFAIDDWGWYGNGNAAIPEDFNYALSVASKMDISVEKLWKNRTKYVGDNAAIGNILSNLNFPEKLKYNGFQLFTEQQPYAITVNFTTDTKTRNFYAGSLNQTPLKQNAIILFSLIENVDTVNFNLDDSKNPYSESFYRESAQAIMQNDNLFATTETVEGFSDFIKEIPNRLNAGTAILTHDQAVASALFSLANEFPMGECVAESHIILGYDDSDKDETKIYALTAMSKYGFANGNFVEVSGSAFPAVITLFSDNHVEIEKPLDGSDNAKSIEKMFPKEYHDRVFKYGDTERDNLKQQREKYASEYLAKIGREAKIGDYSDFDYTSLTDVGVSVKASNNLENFYKAHFYYPSFIGTSERLENGVRMVYEMSYHKNQSEIRFVKYAYDTNETVEQYIVSASTGDILT